MTLTLPPHLANFTAQEIQLELMRRATFNAYDGDEMVAFLLQHSDLWEATLMDKILFLSHDALRSFRFPMMVPLRCLPDNRWGTDTLYILTATEEKRDALIKLGEDNVWYEEFIHYYDADECEEMLMFCNLPNTYRIFSYWWD